MSKITVYMTSGNGLVHLRRITLDRARVLNCSFTQCMIVDKAPVDLDDEYSHTFWLTHEAWRAPEEVTCMACLVLAGDEP